MAKTTLPVAAQDLIVYWALNHFEDMVRSKKDRILFTDNEPTDDLETLRDFIEAIEMTVDRFASSVRANGMDKDAQDTLEKFSRLV